jgi:alkylation response protein AidB-like acyl-CoA dehydrogenase
VLNGEKCFIANGSVGSLFFVDARTNPDVSIKTGGTLFMVPKTTPGFRVGKVFNKRGWRFYQNAELIFENARVPHANVVGQVGTGSVSAGKGDTTGGDLFGDLELAANALGVCDDACEMGLAHAKTRKRAGKYLLEHQLVQLKVNEMYALTEALRSYVMRVAWLHDRGEHSANAGLVMNYSTDVIQRVTRLNMEIHGPEGCTMNARAEKLVRDAMVWTHLAGDTVQRVKVLKRLK